MSAAPSPDEASHHHTIAATSDPAPTAGEDGQPPATSDDHSQALIWERLRDYEAEEAQSVVDTLQRHLDSGSPAHDKFVPDGVLLFTDRYIQRFLEEEQRSKLATAAQANSASSSSSDWTRGFNTALGYLTGGSGGGSASAGSSPQRRQQAHSAFKESDVADIEDVNGPTLSYGDEAETHGGYGHGHGHAADAYDYDDYAGGDDYYYPDAEYEGGSGGGHGIRSGLSSVGRRLGRKVKFPKVMSLASRKRLQMRDKGKEAARIAHATGGGVPAATDFYWSPTATATATATGPESADAFPLFAATATASSPLALSSDSVLTGWPWPPPSSSSMGPPHDHKPNP